MKKSNPIAWMEHPLAGDIEENLRKARLWMKWLLRTFPRLDVCADWILWCELLDDTDPAERARGIEYDKIMASRCDLSILVNGNGVMSRGMRQGVDAALAAGNAVIDLTALSFPSDANVAQTLDAIAWVNRVIDAGLDAGQVYRYENGG